MIRLAQRGAARRNQSGVTIIEALVALGVFTILVGGVLAAAYTSNTASASATTISRLNTVVTAFGEAIKRLPYQACGDADTYEQAFAAAEEALPPEVQRLRDTIRAELEIVDVSKADCGPNDIGTQIVIVQGRIGEMSTERQIVKRDPANRKTIDFEPVVELDPQSTGTPWSVWDLSVEGASAISSYQWWCYDTDWATVDIDDENPPAPDFIWFDPDREGDSCQFEPTADPQTFTVVLRVTEDVTGRVGTEKKTIEVPALDTSNVRRVDLEIRSDPRCYADRVANQAVEPCRVGEEIKFDTIFTGMESPSFRVDFGDNTTRICQRPYAVDCLPLTHTYVGGALSYQVKITVLNYRNYDGSEINDTIELSVLGAELHRPVALFTADVKRTSPVQPTTALYGIGPQSITFDASASHGHGLVAPAGIAAYEWYWGDGTTSGAPSVDARVATKVFDPSVRTTYVVTLMVTDTNNLTNLASILVVIDPLRQPYDVQVPRRDGFRMCGFLRFCDADIMFEWTGVPRLLDDPSTPQNDADVIEYEITIEGPRSGLICNLLGISEVRETYRFTDNGAPGARFQAPITGFRPFCRDYQYDYTLRTIRTPAGGQPVATAWTNPALLSL